MWLRNKPPSGTVAPPHVFLQGTRGNNCPEPPADLETYPEKYLLDCDAGELGKWIPNPTYDRAAELEAARQKAVTAVKQAGFARVHQDFPPHAQVRLCFKGSTDGKRKECAALIETVKAEVDRVKAALLSASTEAEITAAADSLTLPV